MVGSIIDIYSDMNNLEQKTKELSEAIRQTKEFKEYQKANKEFQSDEMSKKLLQDFQKEKQTLIILKQGGFSGVDSQKEKVEKLSAEVRKNKVIKNWVESREKLQKLTGSLATSLSNDFGFPFTPPPKKSCCG